MAEENEAMILVDRSIIVAWLDKEHKEHAVCLKSLEHWAGRDILAVSAVTYGELAAGGRTREAVNEDPEVLYAIGSGFRRELTRGHCLCPGVSRSQTSKAGYCLTF